MMCAVYTLELSSLICIHLSGTSAPHNHRLRPPHRPRLRHDRGVRHTVQLDQEAGWYIPQHVSQERIICGARGGGQTQGRK